MSGNATAAIVESSACRIVASMIVAEMMARMAPDSI